MSNMPALTSWICVQEPKATFKLRSHVQKLDYKDVETLLSDASFRRGLMTQIRFQMKV